MAVEVVDELWGACSGQGGHWVHADCMWVDSFEKSLSGHTWPSKDGSLFSMKLL